MKDTPVKPVIFVFASTEADIAWTGRAKTALERYGAQTDVTRGLCGQSYAINTHGHLNQAHKEEFVEEEIKTFLAFARANPDHAFLITRIGSLRPTCGNCAHREFRGAVPPARETLGNCAFEPDGYWFGTRAECKNHQHIFTMCPATQPPPTATGWSDSGSHKKAARPVDTPI